MTTFAKAFKPRTKAEHDGYMLHDRVQLRKKREGTIKYIGRVKDKRGLWFGLELTSSHIGKHNGTLDNVEYYKCRSHKGLFVQSKDILRKKGVTTNPKFGSKSRSTTSSSSTSTSPSPMSSRTSNQSAAIPTMPSGTRHSRKHKRTESTPTQIGTGDLNKKIKKKKGTKGLKKKQIQSQSHLVSNANHLNQSDPTTRPKHSRTHNRTHCEPVDLSEMMSSLSLEKVDENEIHRKASIVESLIDTEDELSDLSVHDDVLREDTPVQGTPVQSDDDDRKVNDTQSPTTNNVDNQLPDSNIENISNGTGTKEKDIADILSPISPLDGAPGSDHDDNAAEDGADKTDLTEPQETNSRLTRESSPKDSAQIDIPTNTLKIDSSHSSRREKKTASVSSGEMKSEDIANEPKVEKQEQKSEQKPGAKKKKKKSKSRISRSISSHRSSVSTNDSDAAESKDSKPKKEKKRRTSKSKTDAVKKKKSSKGTNIVDNTPSVKQKVKRTKSGSSRSGSSGAVKSGSRSGSSGAVKSSAIPKTDSTKPKRKIKRKASSKLADRISKFNSKSAVMDTVDDESKPKVRKKRKSKSKKKSLEPPPENSQNTKSTDTTKVKEEEHESKAVENAVDIDEKKKKESTKESEPGAKRKDSKNIDPPNDDDRGSSSSTSLPSSDDQRSVPKGKVVLDMSMSDITKASKRPVTPITAVTQHNLSIHNALDIPGFQNWNGNTSASNTESTLSDLSPAEGRSSDETEGKDPSNKLKKKKMRKKKANSKHSKLERVPMNKVPIKSTKSAESKSSSTSSVSSSDTDSSNSRKKRMKKSKPLVKPSVETVDKSSSDHQPEKLTNAPDAPLTNGKSKKSTKKTDDHQNNGRTQLTQDASGSASSQSDAGSVHSVDYDGDSDGVYVNYRVKDKMKRMGWNRNSGSGSGSDELLNGKQMSTEDEKSDDSADDNECDNDTATAKMRNVNVIEMRIHPFLETKGKQKICSLCRETADTVGCCFIRSADTKRPKSKLKKIKEMYSAHMSI